jgi:hypothetical protein
MISIDSFFSRVLPYVGGCSEPMARQAILDSAIRLCDKSNVIRQTVDAFSTVSGLVSYDLETPNTQMRIARVLAVTVDGVEIEGIFEEDVPMLNSQSAKPDSFYTTRVNSELVLNMHPLPDDAYSVVVTAAYAPTRSATSLSDDLYNYHIEGIVAGAISALAAIPNMPFSNDMLSAKMQMEAGAHSSAAKTESYYGHIRGGTRVKPRPLVR